MKRSKEFIEEKLSLEHIKRNAFYGRYKGFEVTVYIGKISTAYINYYHAFDINDKIKSLIIDNNTNEFVRYSLEPLGIKLSCGGWLKRANLELLIERIDEIIALLIKEKINPNICASGGYDYNIFDTVKIINGRYTLIGAKGLDLIKYQEEDLKRQEAKIPNNYLRGTLGIIAGVFLGAFIWVVLELLGFFSPIAFVFSTIFASMFYKMMGGKGNKYKLITTAISSIIVMLLTTFICYITVAHVYISKNNLDANLWDFIFNNYNIKELLINRLIFNTLFLGLGMALLGSEAYEDYTKKRVKITDMPEPKRKSSTEEAN